jgi:hypothetical protein
MARGRMVGALRTGDGSEGSRTSQGEACVHISIQAMVNPRFPPVVSSTEPRQEHIR